MLLNSSKSRSPLYFMNVLKWSGFNIDILHDHNKSILWAYNRYYNNSTDH